tara:strand:- start:1280 stop:1771 length:492 start_codon:yes stop_codon:yes gene_type:complete
MTGIETAVAIVGGVVVLIGQEIGKTMKYKREKNRIKKNLILAFTTKNKNKIKKYIGYIQDFDVKYNTNKAKKYLDKIVRNNKELNEENVLSLLEDYCMIDRLYDHVGVINNQIENRINIKLAKVEKRHKEVILRNNMTAHKRAMKASKMKQNKGKKGKKGAMG